MTTGVGETAVSFRFFMMSMNVLDFEIISNHWRFWVGASGILPRRGPNSFIFMQFSAKDLQNNRASTPTLGVGATSEKSWIRHF